LLDLLHDPAVLTSCRPELLGNDDDPALLAAGELVEWLLAAATKPAHQAVARWLTALVADRGLRLTRLRELLGLRYT
jgi:hypothetical protein